MGAHKVQEGQLKKFIKPGIWQWEQRGSIPHRVLLFQCTWWRNQCCYWVLPQSPRDHRSHWESLSYACIHKQQQQDKQLMALQKHYLKQYVYKSLDENLKDIIWFIHPGDNPDKQWSITFHSKCYKAWYTGFIKLWDMHEGNDHARCYNYATTTLSSNTLLTGLSMNTVSSTSSLVKVTFCYQSMKCKKLLGRKLKMTWLAHGWTERLSSMHSCGTTLPQNLFSWYTLAIRHCATSETSSSIVG